MWKIGELARRTGLTVRTLHHYDEIGLLSPAERSDGGHRVYGEAEVQRLYRIVSLRSLGFPLEAVAAALEGRGLLVIAEPDVARRVSEAGGGTDELWDNGSPLPVAAERAVLAERIRGTRHTV